jgi:hypothetical protein
MILSFLDILNLFGFSVSSMVITCAIFYGAYSNIYDKNARNFQFLAFAISNVQTTLKNQKEEIEQLKEKVNELEKNYSDMIELPTPPQP